MAGRVRGYFYEDIRDFEPTARMLLRVGSNLMPGPPGAYPTVALGFRYFDSAYRSADGRLRMPGRGDSFRGRHSLRRSTARRSTRSGSSTAGASGATGAAATSTRSTSTLTLRRHSSVGQLSPAHHPRCAIGSVAHTAGVGYPLNLVVCWQAPNLCQVCDFALHNRPHTVAHWRVLTVEDRLSGRCLRAAERCPDHRSTTRRSHGPRGGNHRDVRATDVPSARLWKLPRAPGGRVRARACCIELQALLRRGDDRQPFVAGAYGLARACGYTWTETRRERPTVVSTASRKL